MCCVVSGTLADSLSGYSSSREVLRKSGVSLLARWLRICLTVQGMWVQSLTPGTKTPHTPGQPSPRANYRACTLQEKPLKWEATHPSRRVAPARHNYREPPHTEMKTQQPQVHTDMKEKCGTDTYLEITNWQRKHRLEWFHPNTVFVWLADGPIILKG